eukprot:gene8757-30_t
MSFFVPLAFIAMAQALHKGGGSCTTSAECAFAGVCTDGACVCDPAWTGPQCRQLHLLPARRGVCLIMAVSRKLRMMRGPEMPPLPFTSGGGYPVHPNSTYPWGAAVVQDDAGLYHMFVAEWMDKCPMTYPTWTSSTHIVHATAADRQGPYTPTDVAVPPAAGNPCVVKLPNSSYAMFFTNHRWTGPVRNCSGPPSDWGPPSYNPSSATGISAAFADTLEGPWRVTYDVVNFSCTNPGPVVLKNGTVLLSYKTWHNGRCIGLVSAPSPGAPFTHFPLGTAVHRAWALRTILAALAWSGGVDRCLGVAPLLEDPFLWVDHRGNYHILYHEDGYGGAAHSPDGVRWDYDGTNRAYPYTVQYEDGGSLECLKREEPKVLLEDGVPTLLINQCTVSQNGTDPSPGPGKPAVPRYSTVVVVQPINTASDQV